MIGGDVERNSATALSNSATSFVERLEAKKSLSVFASAAISDATEIKLSELTLESWLAVDRVFRSEVDMDLLLLLVTLGSFDRKDSKSERNFAVSMEADEKILSAIKVEDEEAESAVPPSFTSEDEV